MTDPMSASESFRATAESLGMSPEFIAQGIAQLDGVADRLDAPAREKEGYMPLPQLQYRTQEHPTIKRLERQAMQFAHAASTATNQSARNMLTMQQSFITVLAKLGQRPDMWDEIAEQMIPVNVEMLAGVVSAGVAKLPPAVVVDSEVVDDA